jgi:small subunit ribosomal protein S6
MSGVYAGWSGVPASQSGAWSSRSRAIPQPKQGFMTMALYEHLLIARQDISAQQVDALATHLKTILEGEEGKVEKQEYWGLRGLAYRIKKNRKGHYVLLNINAPAKAVQELERQLKINEDVLRFITVKVDQFEQSSNKNKREREENKTENADAAGTKAETAGTKEAAQ